MSDPTDESLPEWTAEELSVLRSAADDGPGAQSLAATLAAVGTGTAVASGAAVAKGAALVGGAASATTAKWGSLVAVVKWLGVVALGSVALATGVVLVRRAEPAPALTRAKEARAVTTPAESARVAELAASAAPVSALMPPEADAAAKGASPESRSPGRGAVAAQPDISAEIAALDSARTALRSGRAEDALAALGSYDHAFGKSGGLRVEATALRIEALLRSGQRARATSLATAFLAHNPRSPYAARVRTLFADSRSK